MLQPIEPVEPPIATPEPAPGSPASAIEQSHAPPSPATAAPPEIPAETLEVLLLLADLQRYGTLGPDDLRREQAERRARGDRKLLGIGVATYVEITAGGGLSEYGAIEIHPDGTATMMVLGERCTRACGFCLIDTRKPLAPDASEPFRVAQAVAKMTGMSNIIVIISFIDLMGKYISRN